MLGDALTQCNEAQWGVAITERAASAQRLAARARSTRGLDATVSDRFRLITNIAGSCRRNFDEAVLDIKLSLKVFWQQRLS